MYEGRTASVSFHLASADVADSYACRLLNLASSSDMRTWYVDDIAPFS